MKCLSCIHLLVVALACGCFNPAGVAETSSATTGETSTTGTSTGSPGSSIGTPTTGLGTSTSGVTSTGSPTGTGESGSTSTTGLSSQTGTESTSSMTDASGTTDTSCGNGTLENGEVCDDGNTVNDDGCSDTCERDAVFVFVTNQVLEPMALGNADQAGELCTLAAKMGAAVPEVAKDSKWMGWVSFDGSAAVDRLGDSTLPYRHTQQDYAMVAMSAADVVGDNLDASIRFDEHGAMVAEDGVDCGDTSVWTGTNAVGMQAGNTCTNWTSGDINVTGMTGSTQAVDNAWTAKVPCPCSGQRRIYCFEVRDE